MRLSQSAGRRSTCLTLLIALLLPVYASATEKTGLAGEPERAEQIDAFLETEKADPSAEVDEETQEALARIEEIRARIAADTQEARAFEADARSAAGDDAWALHSNAIELQLSVAADFSEMVDTVNELAEKDVDVSTHLGQLREIAPISVDGTQQLFDTIKATLERTSTDLAAASGEDAIELARRSEQLDGLLERILAVAVDQMRQLESLQLPVDTTHAWLSERVERRGRLAAARIRLWSARRADADASSQAEPEDAALAAATSEASAHFEANISALKEVVSMMDDLEIDSAQYRQLVVESTGEIGAEIFDRRVVGQLLSRWTASATRSLIDYGPGVILKLLVFVLVVTVFWSLSRFVRGLTERALDHGRVKLSRLLKRMITSLTSGSVLVIGLLMGASQLGFEVGPMLAGLGIAGFVLGFALQDTLANFASGIMILAYQPYDVEDLIECAGGVFGKVSRMNLVSTTILTLDNQTRVVPNGKIWGDVITNVTAQKVRRVDMVFGISYTDDIPKAEQVLAAILSEHAKVLDEPEPMIRVHELGDSSVNFIVRPWATREDYWDVHWDVTREVKMRFDREGISIPFPQRDVHFYRESAPGEIGEG